MNQLRFLLLGLGLIWCFPSVAFSQPQEVIVLDVLQAVDVNVLDVLEEVDVNVLAMPSQCEATTHNGCSCTGDKTCTKDNKGKTVTCTSNDNSSITCTDDKASCSCS